MHRPWLMLVLATAVCQVQGRPIQYTDLQPLANVVDIRGIWGALHLPKLPATFCHVGLLGWHCHNSSMQPWDPASLVPASELPPMPSNASCVICPQRWQGLRRTIFDLLLDWPTVQKTGRLPEGSYYMQQLKAAAAQVQQVATAAAGAVAGANAAASKSGAGSPATAGGN